VALTRDFKETVRARVQRDPAFREALLREAVESMLAGGLKTGKAMLRDYINATEGFAELEQSTKKPAKSLMRMLGPGGNPQTENVFLILARIQNGLGIEFKIQPTARARRPKTPIRARAKDSVSGKAHR
jgi:hypothetical protein